MEFEINDKLKDKACRKAHELAKDKGADYCSFGEWVSAIVLDEFATKAPEGAEKYVVTLQFEVAGVAGPEGPQPCDETPGVSLYSLQLEATAGECIEITIRGKSVTIC